MKFSEDNLFDEEPTMHRVDSRAHEIIELIRDLSPEDQLLVAMAARTLNPVKVDEIDLEQEIAEQLRSAQYLMTEVLVNPKANVTSKNGALSSVSRAIKQLVDLQAKTYNIGRLRALEKALVTTLHGHPDGEQLLAQWRDTFKRMIASGA
jgi:hypothetical protein